MGHFDGGPAQWRLQVGGGLPGTGIKHGINHQFLKMNRGDKQGAVVPGCVNETVWLKGDIAKWCAATGAGMQHALAVTIKEGDGTDVLLFKQGVGEIGQQASIGGKQAILGAGGKLT